jgi:hypothetical protein
MQSGSEGRSTLDLRYVRYPESFSLCLIVALYAKFETLDVSVQEEFEKYLQERGINESLAIFIPEYAEYKEQKVCTRPRSSSGYK